MTWRDVRQNGSEGKARDSEIARREGALSANRRHPPALAAERSDTHVTHAQSPVGIGIDAQMPDSMPRAEDDAMTRAGSRDFHDQPGSGGNTARRHLFF